MITEEYVNWEITLLPHKHVTPDLYVWLTFVKYTDKEAKHLGRPLEHPVLCYLFGWL